MKRDKHHITTHARRVAAGITQENHNGNLSRLGAGFDGHVAANHPLAPHSAASIV